MKKVFTFFKNWGIAIACVSIMAWAVLTICLIPGCTTYQNPDGSEYVSLSQPAVETLDKVYEIAPLVQQGVGGAGLVYPGFAGMAGIIAGAIGAFAAAYKRYRPQITEQQTKAETYGNTTKALVYAIEQFKGSNEQDWGTLKQALMFELKDKVGLEYFAVIDALIDSYNEDR